MLFDWLKRRGADVAAPPVARPVKKLRDLGGAVLDLMGSEENLVLRAAREGLDAPPITVTATSSDHSPGDVHDYFSQADYFWPDPGRPGGSYVRRDGFSNPDVFRGHRRAMVRLSRIVGALASAYLVTGESRYVAAACRHLDAWFASAKTRMNPHFLHAQAVLGKHCGSCFGLIDGVHLVEVARGTEVMATSAAMDSRTYAATRKWFKALLKWMTRHAQGREARATKNNHATCWVLQAAAYARLTGDSKQLSACRQHFREVLLPAQMAQDGSFPLELKRTRPYNYSVFNVDAMAGVCQALSVPEDNLWEYATPDGRSMRRAMEFIYPHLADKSQWPYGQDVTGWEDLPTRQPSLLFAGIAFGEMKYLELWSSLNAAPTQEEVLRNLPLRNPLLWIGGHLTATGR